MDPKEISSLSKSYKDSKVLEITDTLTNKKYLQSTVYIPIENIIKDKSKSPKELHYYNAFIKETYNKSLVLIGLSSHANPNYVTSQFYQELLTVIPPIAVFGSIILYKRSKAKLQSNLKLISKLALFNLLNISLLSVVERQRVMEYKLFLVHDALNTNDESEIEKYYDFKHEKQLPMI